jgi:vancomycin resistance protein YoaR
MVRVALAFALSLAALALFLVSAIVGDEVATRDRVKPGVSVLGISVGGLTLDEATARLTPRTAAVLDQPLEVEVADHTWSTSARALGLRLDAVELAQDAYRVGRQASPFGVLTEQLRALRNGTDVAVRRTAYVDELDTLVAQIANELDTPSRNAALSLNEDGSTTYVTSQVGLQLDQAASRDRLAQALADGQPTVTLVAHPLQPTVTTDQVAAAHDQLGRILRDDAQLTVTAADQSWTLGRGDLLKMVSVTPPAAPNSPAAVTLNSDPVQAVIDRAAVQVLQDAQDARFSLSGGVLAPIRESHPGRALDQTAATQALGAQILAGATSVDLPVTTVPPAISTDDASKLYVGDLIDESSTSFVGSVPEKAHNIGLAASRLNGVVVPPGGTFSFNKEVGPTTLEAGFQWGFGLTTGAQGGVHTVPSVAGGICQVATTLFQPVFWAGYQLEERYWHLYWIPAYTSRGTVGLDATVDADADLDFKWINPTSDPVLIQSSADATHVTFRLYGKKPAWSVHVEAPVVSDTVAPDPTPEVQEEPLLPWGRVVPVETARDGFQVTLVRHVLPEGGGPSRDLVLKSIYQPAHTVTLVGTGNAPDAGSVAAALERVRGVQSPPPTAAAAPPPPPVASYSTPNGDRTLAQIRDELRSAGWGGGSDQDALETYNRVAGAAADPGH